MIVEQIRLHTMETVVVREDGDGFIVESMSNVFGSKEHSRHPSKEDAIKESRRWVAERAERSIRLAPLFRLIRGNVRTMGIEGALEYCEKNFDRISKIVEEKSK
jgi:hypothetical protein